MSATIKKFDSEIELFATSGIDGEVSCAGNSFYMSKDGHWEKIQVDSVDDSSLSISLVEINRQIMSQLKPLSDLDEAKNIIEKFYGNNSYKYYMLYGKEISYFTLFHSNGFKNSSLLNEEVISCLKNLGTIKDISLTEDKKAIEIWITIDELTSFLYLFPYDDGVIEL